MKLQEVILETAITKLGSCMEYKLQQQQKPDRVNENFTHQILWNIKHKSHLAEAVLHISN